jgi:VWFA-related protein
MPPRTAVTIFALSAAAMASVGQQQPTFRSSVDVIVVDVQIIGRDGLPVTSLTAGDFEVTIGGKRRQVQSVELVRAGDGARPGAPIGRAPASAIATNSWPATGTGRLFVLAIDATSLQADIWQRVSRTANAFVAELPSNDRIGLFVYPTGPGLQPTADRPSISRGLATVLGTSQVVKTSFNLSTSEIVDISAESVRAMSGGTGFRRTRAGALEDGTDTPTVQRVQDRECPNDANCPARILLDAGQAATLLESQMQQSQYGLVQLLSYLGEIPGRKTVIFLSGGMAVSDVPGGRPHADDLASALGRELAQANAAIYTLHVDAVRRNEFSGASKRITVGTNDVAREASLKGRWLEQFSGASGGTLLRIESDDGTAALNQVLRETSAYYLLGVEPAPVDRDGTLRTLDVKIRARGNTVRHRNWVIVPKAGTGGGRQ